MTDNLMTCMLLAALKAAAMEMRDFPEREAGAPDALHDAANGFGVPDDLLPEVQKLMGALRFFGESVRMAERNNRPIPRLTGEIFRGRE